MGMSEHHSFTRKIQNVCLLPKIACNRPQIFFILDRPVSDFNKPPGSILPNLGIISLAHKRFTFWPHKKIFFFKFLPAKKFVLLVLKQPVYLKSLLPFKPFIIMFNTECLKCFVFNVTPPPPNPYAVCLVPLFNSMKIQFTIILYKIQS